MSKANNRRVYSNANHQPRHKAERRADFAKDRQEEYDQLTIAQKIERLDNKLGKGIGAVKQRARLAAASEVRQTKKEVINATIEQVRKDGVYEAVKHQTSNLDVWEDSKKDSKKYMKNIY